MMNPQPRQPTEPKLDPIENPELEDAIEIVSPSAIESQSRAEIDIQITTAKKFPRTLKKFIQEATEMATLDEETAAECMYALPRDGKTIEGPSARFAEIIASAWGNCAAGARQIDEDDTFVTSQGVFKDWQRNVTITFEVKRRIIDKHGRKFKPDMIGVTSNAASSIALRNAVLKGVPKAYWKRVYESARHAAIGDATTLSKRRTEMLSYFAKMGVPKEKVFHVLDIAGEDDINLDHIARLRGLATAIKEGDTTVDQAFGNGKAAEIKAPTLKAEAAAAPAAPAQPAPLTADTCEVVSVKTAMVEKGKNRHAQYTIVTATGHEVLTTDETLANRAEKARLEQKFVRLAWENNLDQTKSLSTLEIA